MSTWFNKKALLVYLLVLLAIVFALGIIIPMTNTIKSDSNIKGKLFVRYQTDTILPIIGKLGNKVFNPIRFIEDSMHHRLMVINGDGNILDITRDNQVASIDSTFYSKALWQIGMFNNNRVVWLQDEGIFERKVDSFVLLQPNHKHMDYDDLYFFGDQYASLVSDTTVPYSPMFLFGNLRDGKEKRIVPLKTLSSGILYDGPLTVAQFGGEFSKDTEYIYYLCYTHSLAFRIRMSDAKIDPFILVDSIKAPKYKLINLDFFGTEKVVPKLDYDRSIYLSLAANNDNIFILTNVIKSTKQGSRFQLIDVYDKSFLYLKSLLLPLANAGNNQAKANYLIIRKNKCVAIDGRNRLFFTW